MSLDTLLRDAAESGGPPRFDEDDIAARVRTRHRRRRGALAVGAAVVVLACGAAGLALAARGGDDTENGVAEPSVVPAVAITDEAIVGDWVIHATDTVPATGGVTFHADGSYELQGGCNNDGGGWFVDDGDLVLLGEPFSQVLCDDVRHTVDDLYSPYGVPTLYDDGLLRITDGDDTTDLVRADDGSSPDPAAPRAPAALPIEPSPSAIAGTWLVDSDTGPSITFGDDGTFTAHDCNDAVGEWSARDGHLDLRSLELTTANPCPTPPAGGPPYLSSTLRVGVLRSDDLLLLVYNRGALALHRAEQDPTVDVGFTGTRWVVETDRAREAGSAAWIELEDDGTYATSSTCGVNRGTWVADGDGARLTVTEPSTAQNCQADMTSAMTIVSVEPVDGGLLAHYEEVSTPGGESTGRPEALFQDLDALPVPSPEDLIGSWSSTLVSDIGATSTAVEFVDASSARLGSCELPYGFDEGRLLIGTSDSRGCVEPALSPLAGPEMEARLDGEVLYLVNTVDGTLQVLLRGHHILHDTQVTVDGAEVTLRNAYADLGVEDCCREDLGSEDHIRHGFVWAGQQVLVQADYLGEEDGLEPLQDPETSPDGRVVSGTTSEGPAARFDCGGYRFTASAWVTGVSRVHLIDAALALADVLPCEAEPPPS